MFISTYIFDVLCMNINYWWTIFLSTFPGAVLTAESSASRISQFNKEAQRKKITKQLATIPLKFYQIILDSYMLKQEVKRLTPGYSKLWSNDSNEQFRFSESETFSTISSMSWFFLVNHEHSFHEQMTPMRAFKWINNIKRIQESLNPKQMPLMHWFFLWITTHIAQPG